MKKFPWLKNEDAPVQGSLFSPRPRPAAPVERVPIGPAARVSTHPVPPAQPPPQPQRAIFTVGEITRDIKDTLERGYPHIWVRGEISGFRGANPRGHLYFALKDSDACLDAKMWASAAQRLKFNLRDGLS